MRILWFPRLQFDIDKLHITTWREMYNELQNVGISVKIAVGGKDTDRILNIPYIRIPIFRIKFLRILTFWISGYLKFLINFYLFKPDVVILDVYSVWFSFPFRLISKGRCLFILDNRTPQHDFPYQSAIRSYIMEFYTKMAFLYCRYFLDGITVINRFYKEQVCADYKFKDIDIGIWGSGVNTALFSPEKYILLEKPQFLKDKFILMLHGTFTFNRGLFELIDAMRLLKNNDIVLVLIGDGVAKDAITQKIEGSNLQKRVYVLSALSYERMPEYISFCDCAIMAYPNNEYWNHNSPIKLIEYFAMGKVVICTDIQSFKDIAGDRKCAYYIADNSQELILKAIGHCYENRMLLKDWGKQGLEVVKNRYTWARQADNLLKYIKQLQDRANIGKIK